jgi:RNA polymerase sigma-54 factor
MRIGTQIDSRVATTLAMTPRLQQAIRLLQLSTTDLSSFIHEQAIENPLLIVENAESLSLDNKDSKEDVVDSFDSNGSDHDYEDSLYLQESNSDFENDWQSNPRLRTEQTLNQYLEQQLSLVACSKTQYAIGVILIDHLNEHGYLDINIDDMVTQLNVTTEEVNATIELMQKFDPVGIFARNVQECLRIQLQEKNMLTENMAKLLEHIDCLLSISPNQLAKKCGITLEELQDNLSQLRTLNPHPSSSFIVSNSNDAIIPDGFVHKNVDGNFSFELNPDSLPKVLLNGNYYHELRGCLKKTDDKQFLQAKLAHANWLIQALHQRFVTLQRVASAIVDYQKDFFKNGAGSLKSMTLKMIADQLDVHESTVSRVTTEKYISTPRGTFELKFFFSSSLTSISEGSVDVSAKSVQTAIINLIRNEPKQTPLSDEQLVAKLGESGMIVARRTIAKYRNILKIPSSQERRNKYMLGLKQA